MNVRETGSAISNGYNTFNGCLTMGDINTNYGGVVIGELIWVY